MTRDAVFHHLPPAYYKDVMTSPGDYKTPFTTNDKGMRGRMDFVYEKGAGTFRIAVLGDSFTFGMGVGDEELFTRLLEERLNAPRGRRYEVYNFGVASYSPLLEYIYLKNEVVKYRPDLVILMFDMTDVQDDYLYEPHIVHDKDGGIAGCDPLRFRCYPDIWEISKRHSRLLSILDQKLFQSLVKIKTIGLKNYVLNKFRGRRNKTEILTNKDIDNIRFDRFLMCRDGKNEDVVSRHWARTAGYVRMIKEYLDERGIPFILVLYPYGHQAGPDEWAKGRVYWGFEAGKVYDPKERFKIIEDFAAGSNIELINLYEGMARAGRKPLYFASDGHWTAAGHEAVAEALFNSEIFQHRIG
jgi:lysophospholipase L1-like esterase